MNLIFGKFIVILNSTSCHKLCRLVKNTKNNNSHIITTDYKFPKIFDLFRLYQACMTNKMNMSQSQPHFGPPIKIHQSDLFDPTTLKVNLSLTSIPEGLSGLCNLSLILDPSNGCPDQNRINNFLEFPVVVNGTSLNPGFEEKSCKVIPDFASNGRLFSL